VDGPRFGAYVRDQMAARMTAQGELPPGAQLGLPETYARMTGSGELWVDGDGLPLRQVLHVALPGENDYRVEAEIVTDFSGFDRQLLAAAAPPFSLAALVVALGSATADLAHAALAQSGVMATLLVMLALGAVVIRHTRSRPLQTALSVLVIFSMVVIPLLQTDRLAAFYVRQEAVQQAQQAQSAAREQEAAIAEKFRTDPFGPSLTDTDPLAAIRGDNGVDTDRDGLTDVQEVYRGADPLAATSLAAPLVNDGADTDSDGLTDYEEGLLGTNAADPDTDKDLLSDFVEVVGFTANGVRRNTDPLKSSSLNDGVLDGLKCPAMAANAACPDADGDGTVDVFDRDLDGDGVPNALDLSPQDRSALNQFNETQPMDLVIKGLTAGKPTFVEFQLRPRDPNRLWYAFNVLSWMDGDTQGNIQRDDNVPGGGQQPPEPHQDLLRRLRAPRACQLPAVARRQRGHQAGAHAGNPARRHQLEPAAPPADQLAEAGGILASGNVAYVPLQLVTDPDTQNRVAFYAKMFYRPGADWMNPDKVRMVWLVQMLVDQCQQAAGGFCTSYVDENGVDRHNQVQVVHQYYDEWTLTGLNLREDHGVDYAVVYEDPAVDDDRENDSALLALSYGLDAALLSGRDCNSLVNDVCQGDGAPDITIAGRGVNAPTLQARFDRDLNGSVTATQRWAIPNILQVENRSYAYQDQAIGTLVTTDVQAILNGAFQGHTNIMPSLLFARDETYRTTNLAAGAGGGVVGWSGARLTINLNAAGGAPVQVMSGVKIAPYRYNSSRAAWEAAPIDSYWEELGRRYAGLNAGDGPTVAAGKVTILQLYYATLYAGFNRMVAMNGQVFEQFSPQTAYADEDIALASGGLTLGRVAAVAAVNEYYVGAINARPLQHYFGEIAQNSTKTIAEVRIRKGGGLTEIADLVTNIRQGNYARGLVGAGSLLTVMAFLAGAGLFAAGYATGDSDLALAGSVLLTAVADCHLLCAHGAYRE
jgi:hypothetical protein